MFLHPKEDDQEQTINAGASCLWTNVLVKVNHSALDGNDEQLRPVRRAHLVENMRHVDAHRLLRDAKAFANLLVAEAPAMSETICVSAR